MSRRKRRVRCARSSSRHSGEDALRRIGANAFAILSRGLCGVRGQALILNLPGSPNGAVQSLQAVIDILPHAVDLLAGKTDHA